VPLSNPVVEVFKALKQEISLEEDPNNLCEWLLEINALLEALEKQMTKIARLHGKN
jgi:hypothetical protein